MMRVRLKGWVALLILVLPLGCASSASSEDAAAREESKMESSVSFTGQIQWLEVEGGFWGIVTDEGKKLDANNLPEALRRDGARVSGHYRPLHDAMSFRMWGTIVELVDISAVDP